MSRAVAPARACADVAALEVSMSPENGRAVAAKRLRWPAALWLTIIVGGYALILEYGLGWWAWVPWTIVAAVLGGPAIKGTLFGNAYRDDG